MNRSKQIQTIAAKLKHNKDAQEAYRIKLSEMYQQDRQYTQRYRDLQKLYHRAENNVHNLTIDLGELNARMRPTGEVEIY